MSAELLGLAELLEPPAGAPGAFVFASGEAGLLTVVCEAVDGEAADGEAAADFGVAAARGAALDDAEPAWGPSCFAQETNNTTAIIAVAEESSFADKIHLVCLR